MADFAGAGQHALWAARGAMRWLMFALFVSIAALLAASGGLAYHIWREHRRKDGMAAKKDDADVDTEERHDL